MFAARARPHLFFALLTSLPLGAGVQSSKPAPQQAAPTHSEVAKNFGKLPLHFEINEGQTDPHVRFLARGQGYQVFLEATAATMRLLAPAPKSKHSEVENATSDTEQSQARKGAVLRMTLVGANPKAKARGLDKLRAISNYFIGSDPSKWHSGVANYAKVQFDSVYPGINSVYYGNNGHLEHDFVLSPHANPNKIRLSFEGAESVSLDRDGNLNINLSNLSGIDAAAGSNTVQLTKPVAYQMVRGKRVIVKSSYVLAGKNQVGFKLASYDKSRTLTIDPSLIYSTYVGGSQADEFRGIAVDSSGNIYAAGDTFSGDFETSNGSFDGVFRGAQDAIVIKLTPAGTGGNDLIYATYLGGSGQSNDALSQANAIAINSSGNAFVTGGTTASGGSYPIGFPTTAGAYQTTSGGGQDAFVTELSSDGTALVYSTYLGGAGDETGNGIAIDNGGNAYIAGFTDTTTSNLGFPSTIGAAQVNYGGNGDGFVTLLSSAGTVLIYSTYLGGGSSDFAGAIALDSSNNAYVTGGTASGSPTPFPTTGGAFQTTLAGGEDAFVTKVTYIGATASTFTYSTYLGGSNDDEGDGIAVDSSGDAYLTGSTSSGGLISPFPTTVGAYQTSLAGTTNAFITKFNNSASALVYSTFLGGSSSDEGFAIAIDASLNAFITGTTDSTNFPVTTGAPQQIFSGTSDAFVTEINATGSGLVYSTYLGTSGDNIGFAIALDSNDNAYVAGSAGPNFPTTSGAFQPTFAGGTSDGFLVVLSPISPISAPANHTLLYNVVAQNGAPNPPPPTVIALQDRFVLQSVHVQQPVAFGNPVNKLFDDGDSPIVLDFLHYVAYYINEACPSAHAISVADQFGNLKVTLRGGHVLLAPAWEIPLNTTPVTPIPDETHFRCYDVFASQGKNRGVIDDGNFITPPAVTLTDEFISGQDFSVVSPKKYCVAAIKLHNGVTYTADIVGAANNYMCYEVLPLASQTPVTDITTLDQFGPNIFSTVDGFLLCVPSVIASP